MHILSSSGATTEAILYPQLCLIGNQQHREWVISLWPLWKELIVWYWFQRPTCVKTQSCRRKPPEGSPCQKELFLQASCQLQPCLGTCWNARILHFRAGKKCLWPHCMWVKAEVLWLWKERRAFGMLPDSRCTPVPMLLPAQLLPPPSLSPPPTCACLQD